MAGSGPPPNPQSRKQTGTQAHTWLSLPAGGYDGPIPAWPFLRVSKREAAVWRKIWRTPQAAAWVRLGWLNDIAIYVRLMVAAEAGDMKATTEARQWSDRLGLNPTAMLKNRWRISADEVAEKRTVKASAKRPTRRLKVVDDAVAGS